MKNPLNETRAFMRELDDWVREGIISGEQAAELRARYSRPESETSGRLGLILKAAAALLTGMGMFLLISANWHRIEIAGRMSMGLVPLLATYGLGVFFITRRKFTTAGAWFLLSSILLGVNIFLQAQIFHLSGRLPDAFLWWMLGSLPAAMYFRTPGHGVLLQVLYLAWIAQEAWHKNFSPLGLPVLFAAGFLLYRTADRAIDPERDRAPGRFAICLMAINIIYTLISLDRILYPARDRWFGWILPALSGVGLIFALLCFWRNAAIQHFLDRMRDSTITLIGLGLLLLSMPRQADLLSRMHPSWAAVATTILAAAIIALAWTGLRDSEGRRKLLSMAAWPGMLIIFLLAMNQVLSRMQREPGDHTYINDEVTTMVVIILSLVLLGYALFLLFQGIRDRAKRPFMKGIFFIISLAIARYLDYFEDYVLAAAIFIFAGILLVILNTAWEKLYTEEKNAH